MSRLVCCHFVQMNNNYISSSGNWRFCVCCRTFFNCMFKSSCLCNRCQSAFSSNQQSIYYLSITLSLSIFLPLYINTCLTHPTISLKTKKTKKNDNLISFICSFSLIYIHAFLYLFLFLNIFYQYIEKKSIYLFLSLSLFLSIYLFSIHPSIPSVYLITCLAFSYVCCLLVSL